MDIFLEAIQALFEPMRLGMLVLGVVTGLVIGVIPGIGGVFGLTLLVPLTYTLDPVAAFALLLGMSSVTTTSDTIPAVLLGVPGTVGSAATAIDGHELAKQGQADRAIGAAYLASMIGGLLGALLLALSLPVIKPLVLLLNYGDLFAITLFGLTLVSLLSGGNQFRGLFAALLGILISFVGLDPYESAERWTFGEIYLWDGIPTPVFFLGIFGLSELTGLIARGRIQHSAAAPAPGGMLRGMREALANWPSVFRYSAMGALLGAVPGVGVTVIEWIAYGDAARRKGDGPDFGKGNIRAVIAPESANNAKEGGALLPTLAFGVPGSATMAVLLGALAIHGLVPGPRMLADNAPLMVTMILTIALANVIGTGICLGLTPALARIAQVPATRLVPPALVFVVLGAYQSNLDLRDLLALFAFGALGILFKRFGWSRPALALGFVLGPNLERFFFLSYQISGWSWLAQPLVLAMAAVIAATLLRQLAGWRRGRKASAPDPAPRSNLALVLALVFAVAAALFSTFAMPFATGLFPRIAAIAGTILGAGLLGQAFSNRTAAPAQGTLAGVRGDFRVLGLGILFSVLLLALGLVAVPLFLIAAGIRYKVPLRPNLLGAASVTAAAFAVFRVLASNTWPEPFFARLLP